MRQPLQHVLFGRGGQQGQWLVGLACAPPAPCPTLVPSPGPHGAHHKVPQLRCLQDQLCSLPHLLY